MSISNPKTNKDGKLSGSRTSYRKGFSDDAAAIQKLLVERLPNHTLQEVCLYIAGHFHAKLNAKDQLIKELETELERINSVSRETQEGA